MVLNMEEIEYYTLKKWFLNWINYPYYKYPFSVISFIILQIFFGLPYSIYETLRQVFWKKNERV